jgi:nucleotide-binding universal stress UspA family protein
MSTVKMHLLVGIDFSESSNVALAQAVALATRLGARLHLCYIAYGDGFVADTDLGLNIPKQFPEIKDARVKLQRLLSKLESKVDSEIHVRMNKSPLAGMMGLIMQLKPDMVIVGSNGKRMLKRALLGSVSAELAQRSPVPVIIVPGPEREQLLHQPIPEPEPELPSVGRAVAHTDSGTSGFGIAGIGSGEVPLR